MRHLKKFEEMDYKEFLAQQSKFKQDLEKAKQEEIERMRQEISGKRLSQLADESEKQRKKEDIFKERQELTHLLVQSIIFSELNKPGFEKFKDDFKNFLQNYPLDTLPKSGVSVYRD